MDRTGRVRVLIVDDHPVVREGLAAMLGRRPGLEIIGQADDGLQAVEMAGRLRPDIVLMDLRLPLLDGVAATARLRAEQPGSRVLVLTTFEQDDMIMAALRAGACGYILKDAPADEIARAIGVVHEGEVYLHPPVAARLVRHLAVGQSEQLSQYNPGLSQATDEARASGLTPRETDALRWLASGLSNRDIARRMGIAESTVKTHLAAVYAKLEVSDRAGALAKAVRMGLVDLR